MLRHTFSLALNDENIQALALQKGWWRIRIKNYQEIALPPGVMEDGQIKNPRVLIAAIKGLIGQADRGLIDHKFVNLVLPDSQVKVYFIKVPPEFKKRTPVLDFFKNKQRPPAGDWSDYALSYVAHPEEKAAKPREIMVGAVCKDLIESYQGIFKAVGLEIAHLDMESLALAHSLITLKAAKDTVLLLDIGARLANLAVFDQGYIRYKEDLPWGGNLLTAALQTKLKLSFRAAEARKKQIGFCPKDRDNAVALILKEALAPGLAQLYDIISHKINPRPRRLILAGGTSLLPGFGAYLSKMLKLPVFIGQPFNPWHIKTGHLWHPPVFYAALVGLALTDLVSSATCWCFNFVQNKE